MTRKFIFLLAIIIPVILVVCLGFKKKKEEKKVRGFAVVELFTSEGCNTCPPADEAMLQLAKDFPEHMYVLGYHVDYWDRLGWKDAYSQAAFTQRQRFYAQKLGISSIYTPQIIVNGKKELVGSKTNELRNLIKEQLDGYKSIAIKLVPEKSAADSIKVKYEVANGKNEAVYLALVQLKAETDVKKGENEGRHLRHINIVRELQRFDGSKNMNGTVSFKIPEGLSASDLTVIAFVQDKDNWAVTGAKRLNEE